MAKMMTSSMQNALFPLDLFVTCGKGLESLLSQELIELGVSSQVVGFRGVSVTVNDMETVYRINYCSRIASRVLWPLIKFRCYNPEHLYEAAASVNWSLYFSQGKTFAIDANVQHVKIRNSLFAAQVVKDAICDQFREKTGKRPSVNVSSPDVQFNLFIHNDQGVLSLDTSGYPLHKRGYRQESVLAPLQESLAAGILRLAHYRGDEFLFDPCCGSGTLLLEAALIATKTAPGYLRKHWGFMHLPQFSQIEWLKVKNAIDQARTPLQKGLICGVDINQSAIRACKINLRAAGFQQVIEVTQGDFRDFNPQNLPNLLISNPPHGKRLEEENSLVPLYRALGDFMKRKTAKPAMGFVFTANTSLTKEVGLAPRRRHVLTSGGEECRLLEFELY